MIRERQLGASQTCRSLIREIAVSIEQGLDSKMVSEIFGQSVGSDMFFLYSEIQFIGEF